MLGLYCVPNAFVRFGRYGENQTELCDGPLSTVWFHKGMRKDVLMYHVVALSLMAYAGGVDGKPDPFMAMFYYDEWDDMPLMGKYTRQSPDFPSWLRTIDDAINSKRSNVTPIFERSQVLYWVKKQLPRYTWYLHELLLEEKCTFKNGLAKNCTTTSYYPVGDPKFFVFQNNVTGGANLQVLRSYYFYESNENSNHRGKKTVQLLCCTLNLVGNHSLDEMFLFDTYPVRSTLRVCCPNMCSPDPLLMTDFANTLATIWLLTLKSLFSKMTNETSKYVDNARIV